MGHIVATVTLSDVLSLYLGVVAIQGWRRVRWLLTRVKGQPKNKRNDPGDISDITLWFMLFGWILFSPTNVNHDQIASRITELFFAYLGILLAYRLVTSVAVAIWHTLTHFGD